MAEMIEQRVGAAHSDGEKLAWIERAVLLLLLAALLIGVAAVLKPFTTAILFGTALATAGWPLRQALVVWGLRRGAAAGLMLLISLAIIVVPAVLVAPHLSDQLAAGIARAQDYFAGAPQAPEWLGGVPLAGKRLVAAWNHLGEQGGNIRLTLQPYAASIEHFMVVAAQELADSMLQLILSLAVATMFWVNGAALVRALDSALQRLGGPVAHRVLDVAAGAIRGVAYGVVGTAAIQAVLLGGGLALAGVPGAAMLAFVALLLAITQIGAPLLVVIWGGAAVWLFRHDQQAWGIFMIVWGVFVSTVDNFIKPWLIGMGISMPMSLIILGVFGGFTAFGFLGLFIGPALMAVAYTLVQAWQGVEVRR